VLENSQQNKSGWKTSNNENGTKEGKVRIANKYVRIKRELGVGGGDKEKRESKNNGKDYSHVKTKLVGGDGKGEKNNGPAKDLGAKNEWKVH